MTNELTTTKTDITPVKNLGGRPVSISQNQVIEIVRIKGEYGILTWNKAIDLCMELHPTWQLPHYKNCMIQINKLFGIMPSLTNQKLDHNRSQSLKKTLK